MWKPKYFRKSITQQLPIENVIFKLKYDIKNNPEDPVNATLTVHLPSMRVSERHYELDKLIKYVQNSPNSKQHIEHLRLHDPILTARIWQLEAVEKEKVRRQLNRKFLYRIVTYAIIAVSSVWIIVSIITWLISP